MRKKEGIQMEQELGKRRFLSEDLQKALAGKKIVLAGIENNCRRSFTQQLLQLAAQSGNSFTVSQDLREAGAEDYVLLFGCPDKDGYVKGARESGVCKSGDEVSGADALCTTDALPAMLAALAEKNPAAAVFVSDNCVYGKCFGKEKARKEQELGYVCHTAISDEIPSRLRFAENLAHRLAKEEGVQIAVVRMGASAGGKVYAEAPKTIAGKIMHTEVSEAGSGERVYMQAPESGDMRMLEAALCVLLYGEKGGVYNLSGTDAADDDHSPLSPMQIVTDTTKAEALIRR